MTTRSIYLRLLILSLFVAVCPLISLAQSKKGGEDVTLHGQVVAYRLVNEPKQPHLINPNGFIFMVDILLIRLPKNDTKSTRPEYIVVWSPYRAVSSREFESGKNLKYKLKRTPACDDARSITKDSADFPSFVDIQKLPLGKELPCYLATAEAKG